MWSLCTVHHPTPCLRWSSRPDTPARASRRIAYNSTREFGGISTRELSHRRDHLVKSTEDLGASKKVRKGGLVTVDVDERGDIVKRQHARCESENKRPLSGEHGVKLTAVGPFDVDAGISGAQLDHDAVYGDSHGH